MLRRILVLFAVMSLVCLPSLAQDEDTGIHSGGDIVHFGSDIRIPEDHEAADVVCFLCSVDVQGSVRKDIVVFLGSVHISGKAEHDVVVFGGNVSIRDHASIGHDLVVIAGSRRLDSTASIGHDSVIFPFFLFVIPLLFLVLVVMLVIRMLRWLFGRNRIVYGRPYP